MHGLTAGGSGDSWGSQIGRRADAAALAAGLGERFSGHSMTVGMAQDLSAAGAELPALMQAGRWSTSAMPARYTEAQGPRAGRGGPVLPRTDQSQAEQRGRSQPGT